MATILDNMGLDRTSTQEKEASWPDCKAAMDALADELLQTLPRDGRREGALAAALTAAFPGLPYENCYWNCAAIAIMRHIRHEQQRAAGIEADKSRLRAKNLPESYAERPRAQPLESVGEYD